MKNTKKEEKISNKRIFRTSCKCQSRSARLYEKGSRKRDA